jgi:hypothetical protein
MEKTDGQDPMTYGLPNPNPKPTLAQANPMLL